MECLKKYYQVEPANISYLKFIIEAYDGLATVTTLNPHAGLVVLFIPPGREYEAVDVIEGLKTEIFIESKKIGNDDDAFVIK